MQKTEKKNRSVICQSLTQKFLLINYTNVPTFQLKPFHSQKELLNQHNYKESFFFTLIYFRKVNFISDIKYCGKAIMILQGRVVKLENRFELSNLLTTFQLLILKLFIVSDIIKDNYLFILFILMILMREGDTPEDASPKGLGWPLHREKKKNFK